MKNKRDICLKCEVWRACTKRATDFFEYSLGERGGVSYRGTINGDVAFEMIEECDESNCIYALEREMVK